MLCVLPVLGNRARRRFVHLAHLAIRMRGAAVRLRAMLGGMRRTVAALVAAFAVAVAVSLSAQRSTATVVYEAIAPAVVFVETDGGTGSGLVLESRTILTAAHVVYPYRSARIVFPHGTELLDVPVIGWDLMADVAVLGPVPVDTMPALPPFDTSNRLAIGADLFVIGYPGEEEAFPQPTISRGILSRYRRWADQEATYLQTDASLDDGQSGGVVASSAGAVVGMTVFGGHFGHFGMALSAADVLPRAAALLAGGDPAELGDRGWREAPQATPIRLSLDNLWAERAFVIEAQADQEVTFAVRSRSDVAAAIVDGAGYSLAEADENEFGTESITVTLDGVPPFFLLVEQFSEDTAHVTVEGDASLTPLNDADDGIILDLPGRQAGAIDYPYDLDYYLLPLNAGDVVRVLVDSTQIDPLVRIDFYDSPAAAEDDDSGGGVFGLNAELVYRAEEDRTYRIAIDDPGGDTGGYTLTLVPENDE